ncbi:Acyl-CoA thioesterase [Sandaracinus amylolyticus]|nr:Acyl-CoA thioesterase [Sandaracinus amylolyticus]
MSRARFAPHVPDDRTAVVRHRARVGYVDTDKAGVVHHTVYLVWMEAGRIEYLRARGVDYRRFEVERGLAMPVVEASLAYRSPARFDDEVVIETWVSSITRARIVFEARVLRDGEVLCEGAITTAVVHLAEARPVSVPEELRRACS